MDPKSSKEISNNDLKCALGPTMAQRKVSEKENKLCTSKAQVCWGGGVRLRCGATLINPRRRHSRVLLLSRLELLQLLGPSWEVWDLVVDGQVLQRPQLVFYWVQGFCPTMNLAKANSCSDRSDDQKKGQAVMVYREFLLFGSSMIKKRFAISSEYEVGRPGISQSTWQRIPCSTMYPGGQLVVSLK